MTVVDYTLQNWISREVWTFERRPCVIRYPQGHRYKGWNGKCESKCFRLKRDAIKFAVATEASNG
jgi:hypothetical protein